MASHHIIEDININNITNTFCKKSISSLTTVCICDDNIELVQYNLTDITDHYYMEIAALIDWWSEGLVLPCICIIGIAGINCKS